MTEVAPALSIVPPTELRAVWEIIRDRLADLALDAGDGWMVEEVYVEIIQGNAHLWITEDAEGFVVLTVLAAPWGRDLHVWIACNETMNRAADYWEQLKEIARDNGCSRCMFESSRRWERAIPELTCRHLFYEDVG